MSEIHPLIRDIKQRRINLGLTQTAFAKAAGISKTAVCEIERGHHKPGLDVLVGMAKGVGLVVSLELDPTKHRRIEVCDICRQPWPCAASAH